MSKKIIKAYKSAIFPVFESLGFSERNDIEWVKETAETIILCELNYDTRSQSIKLNFAVALKALEELNSKQLEYDLGLAHLRCQLLHFLDYDEFFKLIAAGQTCEKEYDWHINQYFIGDNSERDKHILSAFKYNAPKTIEEKTEQMASIVAKYVPTLTQGLSSLQNIGPMIFDHDLMIGIDVKAFELLDLVDRDEYLIRVFDREAWAEV